MYTDLGYDEVSSFIASGNVVLTSNDPPDVKQLEEAFERRFGFDSEVFLRDSTEVTALLERVPWGDTDGVVEVSFLSGVPDPAAARALEATAVAPEALVVTQAEVLFLRAGKGIETTHKESTSMRMLDMTMTRRGMATVRKMHDRFLAGLQEGIDA